MWFVNREDDVYSLCHARRVKHAHIVKKNFIALEIYNIREDIRKLERKITSISQGYLF